MAMLNNQMVIVVRVFVALHVPQKATTSEASSQHGHRS